jgi:tripartite-type tricarboxylate transporter receptor subunit TctC
MSATSYPDHEILVVAPFPPGHVSDLHPRLLAPHVAEALHQPVTVDNWPGASGTVALTRLKDVAPDGYTVMMHGYGGLAVTPHLIDVAYDPRTDFTAIVHLMTVPLVLVVNASMPVDSVEELIALAGSDPAAVRGGSFGVGSNSHLALILFNRSTGLEIPHSAYPGGFQTGADAVLERFDLMLDFPPVVKPHIAAGRLKPLAVTTKGRSGALPDVPTLEEAGVRGVEIAGWQGLIGPRGMPPESVVTLNAAFREVQGLPEVRRSMEGDGYDLEGDAPEVFAAFIKDQYERWGALIEEEGIRLNGL